MKSEKTSIQISVTTRDSLNKIKIDVGESYDRLLRRLLIEKLAIKAMKEK